MVSVCFEETYPKLYIYLIIKVSFCGQGSWQFWTSYVEWGMIFQDIMLPGIFLLSRNFRGEEAQRIQKLLAKAKEDT